MIYRYFPSNTDKMARHQRKTNRMTEAISEATIRRDRWMSAWCWTINEKAVFGGHVMPSPFPGMDPYLEAPGFWEIVHAWLGTYCADALNALLPDDYAANPGERIYVVERERPIVPATAVIRERDAESSGTTAVMTSDPPRVITVEPYEVREPYVEIVRISTPGRIVTSIEFLSPRNKTAGPGRELYLRKQEELLASHTHLIEIDLIRRGLHTVAAPEAQLAEGGPWTYVVSLHRAGEGERYEVWPLTLHERLPRVRVPLAEGDPDVVLDVQDVLDRCYDTGRLARQVDYATDPPVPQLLKHDRAWLHELLTASGLRSSDPR